jgi:tetratricopeptide (TPR) repeat protein
VSGENSNPSLDHRKFVPHSQANGKNPMARKCVLCKLESNYDELFRSTKKGKLARHYCPECWKKRSKRHARRTARETWASLLILAVFSSTIFIPPHFGGALPSALFTLLFGWVIVLIIPHEIGHAVAAWLLGFRVFAIQFGYGNRFCHFKILGVTIELCGIPWGGITRATARGQKLIRCRSFLFILAGPAVNVLLFAIVLALMPSTDFRLLKQIFTGSFEMKILFDSKPSLPLFFAATFMLANLYLLASCLWPHRSTRIGLPVESDGLQLLKIPFRTEQVLREAHAAYFAQEAGSSAEDKCHTEAADWCRKGLALYPENVFLRYLFGVWLVNIKDFVKARELLWDLTVQPKVNLHVKIASWSMVAVANILIAESIPDVLPDRSATLPLSADLIQQALGCSQEALEAAPWSPDFKATRGAVLIEAGELNEGLALLRGAVAEFDGENNKAFYTCYIALGEFRSGRTVEANESLAVARKLNPQCLALEVMAREFAEGRLKVEELPMAEPILAVDTEVQSTEARKP